MNDEQKPIYDPSLVYGGQVIEPTTPAEVMEVIEKATGNKILIKKARFNPEFHEMIIKAEEYNPETNETQPIEIVVETPPSTLEVVAETVNDSDPAPITEEAIMPEDSDIESVYVPEATQEYSKMTIQQLRRLCKERNLKATFKLKKVDLIQLLTNS